MYMLAPAFSTEELGAANLGRFLMTSIECFGSINCLFLLKYRKMKQKEIMLKKFL